MRKKRILSFLLAICFLFHQANVIKAEQTAGEQILIDLNGNSNEISDVFYGTFIEDISNGVEGGLYGELLQNRTFETGYIDAFFRFEEEQIQNNLIASTVGETGKITVQNQELVPLTESRRGYGNAVSLSGQGDFLELTEVPFNDFGEFTISFWVSHKETTGEITLLQFSNTAGQGISITYDLDEKRLLCNLVDAEGKEKKIEATNVVLLDGGWNHITLTLSHHVGLLYLNGNEVGSNNKIDFLFSEIDDTQNLMGIQKETQETYSVIFDDIRLYSTALSPNAVKGIVNEEEIYFVEQKPYGWEVKGVGKTRLDRNVLLNSVRKASFWISGDVILQNSGILPISVEEGEKFLVSFWAKTEENLEQKRIKISLIREGEGISDTKEITLDSGGWKKYEVTLQASRTDDNVLFQMEFLGEGDVWIDVVSMFSQDTYKGRSNGIRKDLAEKIEAASPKFLRFLGGSYTQGWSASTAYMFENTIGPIEERPVYEGFWGYETTNGLSYGEILQFAKDIGAEPLLVVNCGRGYNWYATEEELDTYIQSALNAIAYANDTEGEWAEKRRADGFEEPFALKYIEIGNEDGSDPGISYSKRFRMFQDAISEKYPDIVVISCNDLTGSLTREEKNSFIWDYHTYNTPEWFFENSYMWEERNRDGSKIFVGEYACNTNVEKGTLWSALAEAAYLIGCEENCDIIDMVAFAPYFAYTENWQWPVNLIGFDSDSSYGIPSYYVNQVFAQNMGDIIYDLNFLSDNELYCGAGYDIETGDIIIKLVNASSKSETVSFKITGTEYVNPDGKAIVIKGSKEDTNTITDPVNVVPQTLAIDATQAYIAEPYSVNVIRISTQESAINPPAENNIKQNEGGLEILPVIAIIIGCAAIIMICITIYIKKSKKGENKL